MKKVFINYSWEHDAAPAQKVYDKLSAVKEFDVWKDKEKLVGGIEWRRVLRETIREADAFICIMSTGSMGGRRGVRFEEINVALEVLQEFAPDEVFLIPTRVDDCKPRYTELGKLNWVDLFPEIDAGIDKLMEALRSIELEGASVPTIPAPAPAAAPATRQIVKNAAKPGGGAPPPAPAAAAIPVKTRVTPMHSYTVGVVDIDMGLAAISGLIDQLNKAQTFFLFKAPEMPDISKCTKTFGGIKNFAVFKVPKTYISKQPQLGSDLIACITKLPLAFDEGGEFLYNYFAGPSDQDNRFLFLSADHLEEFCAEAGCSFNEGIVSMLVGQLIAYFAQISYHDETRGCVMDFCEDRHDIVFSLKSRKLCPACSKKLPNGDLRTALLQMLALRV